MLYIIFLDTQYNIHYAAFKLKFASFFLNNVNTSVQTGYVFTVYGQSLTGTVLVADR